MNDPLAWTVTFDGSRVLLQDAVGTVRATISPAQTADSFPAGRPLADGWMGSLEVADGRTAGLVNGSRRGLRRHHRAAEVSLGDVRWVYRHTTDRRAVIARNDTVIAKLHHRWHWGSLSMKVGVPVTPVYTFTERGQLGPDDELMVTVFAVVLGPPGREGAIGQIGEGLVSILSIFS